MKRSPLHAAHETLHAKWGLFGEWELPIYYTSILQEHDTVRTKVGIFDVSHLGHLEVSGVNAIAQLQPLFTQDLIRLQVSRAIYSPLLNEHGGIIDEMILYRVSPDSLRLVVNAANGDKVLEWFRTHIDSSVIVQDLRDQCGTLAVQGPKAVRLVERLAQKPLSIIPRYSIHPGKIGGVPILFARTGYTGEDGFELFVQTKNLEDMWNRVLEKGQPDGIQPIGLGARDTLRLEAGLPLGGSDLDEATTPLEAGLEWTIAWEKGPFIGREALERQHREGVRRRLVGFRLQGSGIPRPHYPIVQNGRKVGVVTSGTFLPATSFRSAQAIGLGYVPAQGDKPGMEILIEIHGRQVPAIIVELPFYRRRR